MRDAVGSNPIDRSSTCPGGLQNQDCPKSKADRPTFDGRAIG